MYGTNLDQVGPNMAKLDQLGQVGRHFAIFCLLRQAPLTNLDQVGPVLFPTVPFDRNYYIINSETIMDVNNYVLFSTKKIPRRLM